MTMCPANMVTPIMTWPQPAPAQAGWQCPVCGAVYSPYVQRCWQNHTVATTSVVPQDDAPEKGSALSRAQEDHP